MLRRTLVSFAVLAFMLGAVAAQQQDGSQHISMAAQSYCRPAIAADGERTFLAFASYDEGRSDIHVAIFGGDEFQGVVNASASRFSSSSPNLIIDAGGILHLVWCDSSYRQRRAFICHRVQVGEGWADAICLNPSEYLVQDPHLTKSGDALWCVFAYGYFDDSLASQRDMMTTVVTRRFHDGDWGEPEVVSHDQNRVSLPRIGTDPASGDMVTVWLAQGEGRRKSLFGARRGESGWSDAELITEEADFPSLVASEEALTLSWIGPHWTGESAIRRMKTATLGETGWSEPELPEGDGPLMSAATLVESPEGPIVLGSESIPTETARILWQPAEGDPEVIAEPGTKACYPTSHFGPDGRRHLAWLVSTGSNESAWELHYMVD